MNIRHTLIPSSMIAVTLVATLASGVAQAASWNAVSLGLTPDPRTARLKYSAASFIDGQYTPRGSSFFILSDIPNISDTPEMEGEWRRIVKFREYAGLTPPTVDTVSKTIDVSSFYWEDQQAESVTDCFTFCDYRYTFPQTKLVWAGRMGGYFGATAPVPYAQNDDGTFTATFISDITDERTWESNALFFPFQTNPIYFTFAAAVPEPAPVAMLAVGLAAIIGARRRRTKVCA